VLHSVPLLSPKAQQQQQQQQQQQLAAYQQQQQRTIPSTKLTPRPPQERLQKKLYLSLSSVGKNVRLVKNSTHAMLG
jgi:hypothetical protein